MIDLASDDAAFGRYARRVLALYGPDRLDDLLYDARDGRFRVLVNDVFWWGTADAEDVDVADLPALEAAFADVRRLVPGDAPARRLVPEFAASVLYAARRRTLRPQGAAYSSLPTALWPPLDACGPARDVGVGNPYAVGEYRAWRPGVES